MTICGTLSMSFLESLGNSIRNGFCTVANTAQDFGIGLTYKPSYRSLEFSVDILRLAERLTCNREPSPGYNPVFLGGQCFTLYQVFGTSTAERNSGTPPPLGGDFIRGGVPGVIVGMRNIPAFDGSSGVLSQIVSRSSTGAETYTDVLFAPSSVYQPPVNVITSIVRQDGLPDDCGNAYPPVPPSEPGDRTTDTSFTYIDNSEVEHNINSITTYGDIITNIEGDTIIPFQVTIESPIDNVSNVYPFTFNGTLNLQNGDVNYNFGNPNYSPGKQPSPDDYQTDPDIPDVPEDVPIATQPPDANEPDEETQEIMIGVIVTVTNDDTYSTVIYQDDNPDIYAPTLGYVNFQVAIQGDVAWTSDQPVKNKRNLILCPWDKGAIAVRGTPRAGVEWTLSPVRALEQKSEDFD